MVEGDMIMESFDLLKLTFLASSWTVQQKWFAEVVATCYSHWLLS